MLLYSLLQLFRYQRLTPLGVQLSKLPIEPKMGYSLLLSNLLGVAQPMCLIASAACYQDPVRTDSPLKMETADCYSDQVQTLRILYKLYDTQ